MRKSLFAIGLLAISYSVQAQILCHVDTNANMYVSEGTLVYSGGGVQTKGNGLLDVHGNIMVEGGAGDALKTIDASGADKTDGGNIILRLNTPATYDTSTYGQLYINGLSQSNITGVVTKEFRSKKHGDNTVSKFYQQLAVPFYNKVLATFSTEFGKTFNTVRRSGNEILKWNNTNAVADDFANLNVTTADAAGYYMFGSLNNNLDTSTPPVGTVYNLNGRPNASFASAVNLQGAGTPNFGTGGNNINGYNEKYNSYLQDQFESSVSPWNNTFGKNIYQYGNPFFTNLDLSRIGYSENLGVTDGNSISNIWGVRYDPGVVTVGSGGNAYSTGALIQTFDPTTGAPVGDVGLIIKPMQTFVLKLRDNTPQTLNFNTLRRFSGTVRAAGTDYSVNAARVAQNGNVKTATGTVKQLGVIGLDSSGKEIARTYYVVSPTATTGHQNSVATSVQATLSNADMIGTFEEALNGGYDPNYTSQYWLYINEANETNFLGKNVKLVNYKTDKVKSYKFEIRENGELIPAGVHQLSAGIGFYYKASNGTAQQAKQGDVISVATSSYDLYYGEPINSTLAAKDTEKTPSRTMVVYNPQITNYIVRFDPNWKKADIEVYDMSGKLVISKKAVDASRDFVIELDSAIKNSYIVKIVSDKGEIVNTKILK
ncbi:MAG: T9SS type A sorting domain-containing protein [Chryseobacterium sp.]|uniref:T9SS type A sorting domain-containing protein n=1 Tax=Chryseobacterium sp. TaxID=1871047 RepID=UPI0025C1D272|nr:T9SS type A sorting domain-containing protein [Chryseobacterium sp.]MCJ7934629.1 T9SS type A sorting domain-containing protein [Chryseobacterium sp.]